MRLSSALYRASLQCDRRAWLRSRGLGGGADWPNRTALAELRAVLPRRFRTPGTRFGERIEHADLRAEIDLYEPRPDGSVRIGQARATTQVRSHDVDALLLAYWMLRERGERVERAEIIHLNPDYVRGPGDLDLDALILCRDVRQELEFLVDDVADELTRLRTLLALEAAPEVEPSPHCQRPSRCEFLEQCAARKPADWIAQLPGLSVAHHAALCEGGTSRIADIPEEFPLTPRQARARWAHRAGGRAVDPTLGAALARGGPPAFYLDFETWMPCLPPHAGGRALRPVPMQWSLHRVDAAGVRSHREFLADARGDPRGAFARSLLASLGGSEDPVLVYSDAEAEILRELERELPELAGALRALRARLVDLLRVVRDHVYDTAFRGSFRLKRVASVLCPGFGWDDLGAVREGLDAARLLGRLATEAVDDELARELRGALLAYCARDTLALVELHRALRALAQTEGDQGSAIE